MEHASPAARPQGCTSLRLRKISRLVSQRYDQALAALGLKSTQYSLLSHIVALEPVRPADLAQAMAMEPSTLTRNLKPLLEAGWVELRPGDDGRSRQVRSTAAGRELRQAARRLWRQAQDDLTATLGAPRVRQLHRLLDDSLLLLQEPARGEKKIRAVVS